MSPEPSANRTYTGVGSRETPDPVAREMRQIAAALARAGWTLRSGGAPGADTFFEEGARSVPEARMEIFLPWKGFNGNTSALFGVTPRALEIASQIHPRWDYLSPAAMKLHGRNVYQVLGRTLDRPSQAVICWTKDGATNAAQTSSATGGTGTAIRLASRYGVSVFNLGDPNSRRDLASWLAGQGIEGVLDLPPTPPTQLELI